MALWKSKPALGEIGTFFWGASQNCQSNVTLLPEQRHTIARATSHYCQSKRHTIARARHTIARAPSHYCQSASHYCQSDFLKFFT